MKKLNEKSIPNSFGSEALDQIVKRLQSTNDPKKRYEYVLWMGKKLPLLPQDLRDEEIKVKGCISQVYVLGRIENGTIKWQGFSDALITKGLLSLLIQGLNNLTPEETIKVDPSFVTATGLNTSLTPSRANGFLNILLSMKSQAQYLKMQST